MIRTKWKPVSDAAELRVYTNHLLGMAALTTDQLDLDQPQ